MTDLTELERRLREAKGPDREIDALIFAALEPEREGWSDGLQGKKLGDLVPRYMEHDRPYVGTVAFLFDLPKVTGSIDDALALVERLLPRCAYRVQRNLDGSNWAELQRRSVDGPEPFDVWSDSGNAASLPLAILTALVSALSGDRP